MKKSLRTGAALAMAISIGAPAPPTEAGVDKSDNVKLVARFSYKNPENDFFSGGTDIDFKGRFVYATQQGENTGGIHVVDVSGKKPKKVAFIPCPGGQNDVAVVKKGLLALGYHESTCTGEPASGVLLIGVKNPKKPRLLGSVTTPQGEQVGDSTPDGTHTLTVYPGKDIIYASPGGLPTNGDAAEQIIDVSKPRKPKIVATFTPNPNGCHDVSFYISKKTKIAACVGLGESQIWDVSDPLDPEILAHIPNPFNQFNHSAAFTDDGKFMVIGDEALAGNECAGGPTGAQFIYDISDPSSPQLRGYFGTTHGPLPAGSPDVNRNTWCSSHLFNFIPGTHTLVSSWYAAGMTVVDWSDPAAPEEVAFFSGTDEDQTNYWSAYWYRGRIYANDRVKGLDVFEVKGLREK